MDPAARGTKRPSAQPFAEFAARSNFSFLDGASHPWELAATARALGYSGLGICDTNTLAGVVRGHVAAKEAGMPYAVGCRLRLERWCRIPRLADLPGLLRAPDRPAIPMAHVVAQGRLPPDQGRHAGCRRGLGSGGRPAGGAERTFRRPLQARRRGAAGATGTAPHGGRVHTLRGDDQRRLAWLGDLAASVGGDLLAVGDVRYHVASRRRLADVLTAIRLGTTVDAIGAAAEPNAERRSKPLAEVALRFARHPKAVANTLRVLEATRGFSLDQLRYEYPDEVVDPGRTA